MFNRISSFPVNGNFSYENFVQLLDLAAGRSKNERLSIIEKYDSTRRRLGATTAFEQLKRTAPLLAHRRTLSSAAEKIRDTRALYKITKVLEDGDEEEIERVSNLLSDEIIDKSISAQTMTDDRICELTRFVAETRKVRRRWRMETKQSVARINLALGLVGAREDQTKHCTPFEINLRDEQKARWVQFGEQTELVKNGKKLRMTEVISSAGRKRASEIYSLSLGLEKYAKADGKTWAFITLTAPPQMHPSPSTGRSSWDGTLPDEAHNWIASHWKKAEARMCKANIKISGVRVVEPHQDGCPHWHILVFESVEKMKKIEEILRTQRGAEHWKNEAGLKFIQDDGRAAAASYLFKYVLKTVSSVEKLSGDAASTDAWRSTWGIRAFAWMGIPPLALWRNLRKLETPPEESSRIGSLWRAARRGDATSFIGLAGGLNLKRGARPVQTRTTSDRETKQISFLDRTNGERVEVIKEKWERRRITPPAGGKVAKVEVVLNYPRKAKAKTATPSAPTFFDKNRISFLPKTAAPPPTRAIN